MDKERIYSLFTEREIKKIQSDSVLWYRFGELGLTEKFETLFSLLLMGGAGA